MSPLLFSRPLPQIRERNDRIVKNFGITVRYNSRSGTHNMYKEFRDTTLCGAVQAMCTLPPPCGRWFVPGDVSSSCVYLQTTTLRAATARASPPSRSLTRRRSPLA